MVLLALSFPRWLAVLAAVSLLWWLWRRRAPHPSRSMQDAMARDAMVPLRRWSQAAFMVVTGDCDYAYLPRADAIRMLSTWWDVHGPNEHRRTLSGLGDGTRPDNAWDLLRFILLARLGVAAGYLDDLASWAAIRPMALRLQAAYPDWATMAQAYVMARRQARGLPADGTGDDDSTRAIRDNIAHLHGTAWRQVAWRSELGEQAAG